MAEQPEYVSIGEAAEILGVDRWRMRILIQRRGIATKENPLDLRERLVSRADAETLAKEMMDVRQSRREHERMVES